MPRTKNKYSPITLDHNNHIISVKFPRNGDSFYTKSYTNTKKSSSMSSRTSADSTPNFIGANTWGGRDKPIPSMVVITGQNGHGKTELLKHIRESLKHTSDELIFFLKSDYEFQEANTNTIEDVLEYDKNMQFLQSCLRDNILSDQDRVVKRGLDMELIQNLRIYKQQNLAFSINSDNVDEGLDYILQRSVFETLESIKSEDPDLYLHLTLSYYKIRSDQIKSVLELDGKDAEEIRQAILNKLGNDPRDVMNDALGDKIQGYKIAELTTKYRDGSRTMGGDPLSNIYQCGMVDAYGRKMQFNELSSGQSLILQLLAIWQFSFFNPDNLRNLKVKVMLLDEPDKHLDPPLCKLFIDTIRERFTTGSTQVIMTTHSIDTVAFTQNGELFACKKNNQGIVDILPCSKALATLRLTKNTREISHLPIKVYTEAIDDAIFFENIYQKLKKYSYEISETITQPLNKKTLYWPKLVSVIGQQNWQTRILSSRVEISFHSTSSAKDGSGGGASIVEANLKRDILTHRAIITTQFKLFPLSTIEPFGIVDKDFGDHHFLSKDIQGFDSRFTTLRRHSLENFIYDPLIMSSSLSDGFYTKIKQPMQAILLHLKNAIVNKNLHQIKASMKAFFMKICQNIIQYKIDSDSKFYKDVKLDQLKCELTQKEIEKLNKKKIIAKIIQLYDQQQKNLLLTKINEIINLQPIAIQALLQSKIQEAQPYAQNLLEALTKVRDYNTGNHQISLIPIIFQRDIIEVVEYSLAFNNMQGHLIEDAFCHFFLQGTTKIELKQEILYNMVKINVPIPYDLAEAFFELNAKLRKQMNSVIKPEINSYSDDQLQLKGYYTANNIPAPDDNNFYQQDYSSKFIIGSFAMKELIESASIFKYFVKDVLHISAIVPEYMYTNYIKYIDNNYFFILAHYIACNIGIYSITSRIDFMSSIIPTAVYVGKIFTYEHLSQQKQLTQNITEGPINSSREFIEKCSYDIASRAFFVLSSNVVNEMVLGVALKTAIYDVPINVIVSGTQCYNVYNQFNNSLENKITSAETIIPFSADIIMLCILLYKVHNYWDIGSLDGQMIAVKQTFSIVSSVVAIDYMSKLTMSLIPQEIKENIDYGFSYGTEYIVNIVGNSYAYLFENGEANEH